MFTAAVAVFLCSAYLSIQNNSDRQLDTALGDKIATTLHALSSQITYRSRIVTAASDRHTGNGPHSNETVSLRGSLTGQWQVARTLLSIQHPEADLLAVDARVERSDNIHRQIQQRIGKNLQWDFLLTGLIEQDRQMLEVLEAFKSQWSQGAFKSYFLPVILWLTAALMFVAVPRCTRRDQTTLPEVDASIAEIALETIPDGIISTDSDANITFLNSSARAMTGWSKDDALGKPLDEVLKICSSETPSSIKTPALALNRGDTSLVEGSSVIISRAGGSREVYSSTSRIQRGKDDELGTVFTFRDTADEHGLSRKLIYQARHDSLTGLPNRNEFEYRLNRLCLGARNRKQVHAMLYIDIDQFKVINDTCGHLAGDTLLKQLSDFLKREMRHQDTLARLGGDEFGMLIESCSEEHASVIAEKLLYNIQSFRFSWKGKIFTVGASIGLISIQSPGKSVSSIMAAVDSACYAAKDAGRNRIVVYNEGNSKLAQRDGEMQWVARITQALEDSNFSLFFQSIVPIEKPYARGPHYEVLLRLNSDENSISAGEFLPAAERYGLSNNIDRWVLSRTLLWLRQHPHHLEILETCSINLSGQSIGDENFLKFASEQFHITRVPATKICFEITETAIISNISNAVKFIGTLKLLGCQFALDDFGSGLSSFGYLRDLEVDYLKIDGIFIKDMLKNPVDRSMVKSISQIGHVMKKKIVAEFVEHEDLIEPLKACGIDYLQGYAIDRPMPLDDLLSLSVPQSLAG